MTTDRREYLGQPAGAQPFGVLKGTALLAYVAAVHAIDTLAVHNVRWLTDWSVFRIQSPGGFDAFKFVAWLVVPLVLFLPSLDRRYFTLHRWKRADYWLLLGAAGVAMAAIAAIPLFPSLRETYAPVETASGEERLHFLRYQLLWTFSWLVGWEFLHRYVLVTRLRAWWGPWAWVLVPLIEGLYHVVQQKPLIESAGVVAFGAVLCLWTIRRDNVLLPFLAHLMVELALIAFLVLA